MELAYVAHSERCALLLDRDGICRWAVPKVDANDEVVVAAKRCIGAQFVASLDPDAPGFMTSEPRIGRNMLFALVTDGRVALLRFGPLLSFEKLDAPSAEAAAPQPAAKEVPETIADPAITLDAPVAPAVETAVDVTEAAEADPLSPTIAKIPDLDDMLASFSQEHIGAEAEDATLEQNPHEEEDATLTRAAPPPYEVTPPAPDSSSDLATMAFARTESAAHLDALLATAATPREQRRDVDTSEAGAASADVFAQYPLANRAEELPPCPSGFVLRAMSTEPDADDDISTRRFARASGDPELGAEGAAETADLFDLGLRGMFPRRS